MITNDISETFDVMHLADSFFPTGLFATSNGIEKMYYDKKVTTPEQLLHFIETILENQIGPSDCIILANTYDCAKISNRNEIAYLDQLCSCMKPIKETRDASVRSGNQLVKCVKEFENNKLLGWYVDSINESRITGIYPVSFALCCSVLNISKQNALSMFLYGFVVSNIGASLRLGMIQHYEGQNIIHTLKPLMKKIVNESITKSVSDIWQFSPQIDIFQMRHEKLDSKMFIT